MFDRLTFRIKPGQLEDILDFPHILHPRRLRQSRLKTILLVKGGRLSISYQADVAVRRELFINEILDAGHDLTIAHHQNCNYTAGDWLERYEDEVDSWKQTLFFSKAGHPKTLD